MLILKNYKKYEQENHKALSIAYQLLANLTLCIIGLQAKLLKRVPTTQLLINRNCIQLLVSIVFQQVLQEKSTYYVTDKQNSSKVYARAIIGSFNACLYFYGIMMVSLSEATIISRTAPLWTAIIMIYILKRQEPSKKLLVSICLCSFGIILVVKPPFFINLISNNNTLDNISNSHYDQSQHMLGAVILLLAAFLYATSQVVIKDLGETVSPVIVVNQLSIGIVLVSAVIQISVGYQVILTFREIVTIASTAILGFIAQVSLTKSFQMGNVTQLSLVGNVQVIFSLFFDFLILDSKVDTLSIIGIIIMVGSLIFNTLMK